MPSYEYERKTTVVEDAKFAYKPTKKEREVRRKVYDRYEDMRDDDQRKEAEEDWKDADKMFRMYQPPKSADDWRSSLVLPDAFAGIQADMQERVERKQRPGLVRVEDSDKGKEQLGNAVMTHNMNTTGFDFQVFLAKYAASIRGTSFLLNYWRTDKRNVKDASSVDGDGSIVYKDKEIIDFDDDYTQWVENEYIFIDPAAWHIDVARDMVHREIIEINEFKRIYGKRADFINVDRVREGGDTSTNSFFKRQDDMNDSDVEVLHYYNRAEDMYYVVANNLVVRMGPLPSKHKELPVVPLYHYMVPGRFWGMGIPRVIKYLTEERKAIRNLNLDRQKMQINKMFLVNDQVDIDEEEAVVRPHGFIEIATNGLPLNQAVQPLEYGDVPPSYFRTEEILLEDIRRAHGIDDRIQGVNVGGTATEAAILKESSLKRVNLVSNVAEMDSLIRLGKLKWSNIQFFYKAPRVERIVAENKEREKKSYRKITADSKQFEIVKNEQGENELKVNEIEGKSTFEFDKTMARFTDGQWDVVVDGSAGQMLSKPLRQAKITEMLTAITGNPVLGGTLDPRKAAKRYLEVNDEKPKDWMPDEAFDKDSEMIADMENTVMKTGIPLAPTKGAREPHTMVHMNYLETAEAQQLPEEIQQLIIAHVTGEHDANPSTGATADLLGGQGGAPVQGGGGAPQIQPADLQASTVTGEETPNTGENQNIALQ